MKKIIWLFLSVIIMIGGIQTNTPTFNTQGVGAAGKIAKSLGDDDPIVIHSHVHTSGGIAISGASVSMKLSGTSIPQYSGSTDSNGDCTFSTVAPGTYQYKVSKTGYYDKIVTLGF